MARENSSAGNSALAHSNAVKRLALLRITISTKASTFSKIPNFRFKHLKILRKFAKSITNQTNSSSTTNPTTSTQFERNTTFVTSPQHPSPSSVNPQQPLQSSSNTSSTSLFHSLSSTAVTISALSTEHSPSPHCRWLFPPASSNISYALTDSPQQLFPLLAAETDPLIGAGNPAGPWGHFELQQQARTPQGLLQTQLPDTIPEFGSAAMAGPGRPFGAQNESVPMGLSPLPPSTGLAGSSGLTLDPIITDRSAMGCPTAGGPYLFHQTPSGSTLCQLGAPTAGIPMDPALCSPASSQSGSQPRLVHLSGGGCANDSGLSSLSGGFGCPGGAQLHCHQNFSPEVRGDLEELEPVPRDRCNTWPLRRAMGLEGQAQTSPLIHDRIPEEESMYEEDDLECGGDMGQQRMSGTDSSGTLAGPGAQSPGQCGMGMEDQPTFEERSDSAIGGDCSSRTDSPPSGGAAKKSSTRRNAWGNMSYADLITQAILASPEKRLTLSQVYEWMVQNVPYFRDKGDSNSSAGWKNSIRHNLSLHSRFMRIQNEGAGKSSWWVINPDAKPGRNPRRRANTMENASKAVMDKKRRGARKRVEQMVQQKGASSSMAASMQGLFPEESADQVDMAGPSGGGPNFDTFRPRAQSTLSVTGPSRLSPKMEPTGFEDIDFPSWMDQAQPPQAQQLNPQVNELLDRTDQMRLDGRGQPQQQPLLNGIKMEPNTTQIGGGPLLITKTEITEPTTTIKQQEPTTNVIPPPSYQELSAVRRPAQMQTNPLLRQLGGASTPQMMSPLKMNTSLGGMPAPPPGMPMYTNVPQSMFGVNNFQWNPAIIPTSGGLPLLAQQFNALSGPQNNGALPLDLENVNAMSVDQELMAGLDMDAVLRNELAQGGQFDLP